jgi:hypothetical protein
MNAAGAGAIAAGIAIPAGLALLSRLFPATRPAPTALPFDQLQTKYRKWTYVMAVVMLAVTAPLSLVFWTILNAVATWCAGLLPPAEVTFAPIVPVYWGFPAFMLAIVCSGFAAMRFVQWRLGDRYDEFLAYWSASSKMDPVKANRVVLGACACLCGIIIALGLRPYVQLRDGTLAVQGYFSFAESRYPLAAIQSIRTSAHFIAPNGSTVSRREYILNFAGGGRWTTASIAFDPDEAAKRAFVETLARRSGVSIDEVDHFAKVEL